MLDGLLYDDAKEGTTINTRMAIAANAFDTSTVRMHYEAFKRFPPSITKDFDEYENLAWHSKNEAAPIDMFTRLSVVARRRNESFSGPAFALLG